MVLFNQNAHDFDKLEAGRLSQPDRESFDVEQRKLEAQISSLRNKKVGGRSSVNKLRMKFSEISQEKIRYQINAITTGDPHLDRRNELHAELENLLLGHGQAKTRPKELIEQLMSINKDLPKKV